MQQTEATSLIINAIREGDEAVIGRLYQEYRLPFLNWAKYHYPFTVEDLLDDFQDAVIILYQNIAEQKITVLSSTIKTYLFGIAKHLLYRRLKGQQQQLLQLDEIPEIEVEPVFLKKAEKEHQTDFLRDALTQLGPACRQLVDYFYYYNYSLEAIAKRMRYKNSDTVKSQKQRCIKQLKELVQDQKELR